MTAKIYLQTQPETAVDLVLNFFESCAKYDFKEPISIVNEEGFRTGHMIVLSIVQPQNNMSIISADNFRRFNVALQNSAEILRELNEENVGQKMRQVLKVSLLSSKVSELLKFLNLTSYIFINQR